MKEHDVFPSPWLKAQDLDGKDKDFEILQVATELVGQDQESKPVIYFKDQEKALICNITNWRTIAELHGAESDNWRGKTITLTTVMVDAFGQTTPAIRIQDQPQKAGLFK